MKVPDIEAHWLHPLNRDNIYWTTWRSGIVGTTPGSNYTVLNESYGWSGDTYKTRPVMEFQRTAAVGTANITDPAMFSTYAMGVYGNPPRGADGEQPLTVYFWCDNANSVQSYIPASRIPPGYIAVMRVTSAAAGEKSDVYMGVMPTPGTVADPVTGWTHGPGVGDGYPSGWATGGEVSQATGYLHTSSIYARQIDDTDCASTNPTYSTSQYCIWDPVTGAYSLSHLVQPGDWSNGMSTPSRDRWSLRRQVGDTSTGPVKADGSPQSVSVESTVASADMGMDALGNMYLYYGMAVPSSGLAYNAGIVKISPARDSDGNIVDGSISAPWRYTNVTKVRSQFGESWGAANSMWGVGIRNGKFLIGTSIGTTPGSVPVPGVSGRQSRLVRIDPLSGLGKMMGSSDNAVGHDNTQYIPAVDSESFDMASAQELMVIQGVLYDDVNGEGRSAADGVKPVDARSLPGQTLALYDADKKLLGSTVSSAKGTYSFIVASDGKYYVRVAQPRVLQAGGEGIAAHQTWGAATSGSIAGGVQNRVNSAVVKCRGGDITNPTGRAAGACAGTLEAPYVDKNLPSVGSTGNEGEWPSYGVVSIQTSTVIPKLDFGFSARGSFGDASKPPYNTTIAQKGPLLQSADQSDLRLGSKLGFYGDGTNAPSADGHDTDDGVRIKLKDGSLSPLQGAALARGHSYELSLAVDGRLAPSSKVSIWQRNNDGTGSSGPISADAVRGANTLHLSLPAAGGGISPKQVRAIIAPRDVTPDVDDANGVFANHRAGAASNNTSPWTVPGEVEDYGIYSADTLIRLQVRVNNGALPPAPFEFAMTNVHDGTADAGNPSRDTDSITPTAVGDVITSPTVHAVDDTSSGNKGVKISDVTNRSGWGSDYSISSVVCKGTTDAVNFPTSVEAHEGVATVTGITGGSDVACLVSYDNHAHFVLPRAGDVSLFSTLGAALVLLSVSGVIGLGLKKRSAQEL
ncbi:hypothetical protein [Bifidobacterium xylocopae]|uniref:Uncharacterized protein n=1 Tax=Bifidobacterium xylocopae TaxID=2493119 RepID=A0A366KCQ3_9BIFI|nr:hypothetical protein [Bifidobacterium xylocopae]RBP99349.1 hypothetical protein CRD59_03860 [Bifidobacterium xylocopae]